MARKAVKVILTGLDKEYYLQDNCKLGRKLGSGSYGAVYEHPTIPDRVIKVTHSYDDAYMRFVKQIIHLRKPSAHLPTIYSAQLIVNVGDFEERYWRNKDVFPKLARTSARRWAYFLIVEMERLESCRAFDEGGLAGSYANELKYSELIQASSHMLAGYRYHAARPSRDLAVATALIRRLINKYKHGTDLHPGNVMVRPLDGMAVFTDPVC